MPGKEPDRWMDRWAL